MPRRRVFSMAIVDSMCAFPTDWLIDWFFSCMAASVSMVQHTHKHPHKTHNIKTMLFSAGAPFITSSNPHSMFRVPPPEHFNLFLFTPYPSNLSLGSSSFFESSLPTLIDIISYIDCFNGILLCYRDTILFAPLTYSYSFASFLYLIMEVVINVPLPFFETTI